MCKKLMFLISLVMVLGLATVASADDYDYTGDYPWSYLYISPWNWDGPPFPSYGGPGLGDKAYISEGGPIVLDTDIAVDRIYGPTWENDVDQTMYLIHDCNLYLDDGWRQRASCGGGVATIEMTDNAKVLVRGDDIEFEGDEDDDQCDWLSHVVLNMTDDTEFATDDRKFKISRRPWDYFELNMTERAYMYIDNRFEAGEDEDESGAALINVTDDAVLEAKEIVLECRDAPLEFNISGNGQVVVNDNEMKLYAGGPALGGSLNVTENGVLDCSDDLELGLDDDFVAGQTFTLNMTGQLINIDGDFKFPAHDEATGQIDVYLYGGLINVEGELDHEDMVGWTVYICGDGVMVVDGNIVDDVLEEALEGHWVACPQLDCFERISPRGNLMVEYDTGEYPGKTKIWVQDADGEAWAPMPDDGATGIPAIAELCWCPGESECPEPLNFHIFLSDVREEVADGNFHAWQGVQSGNCFTTEPLCLGKTYYWRVDSVWDCCVFEGPVWQFTVVDRECIEDMEAYNNATNPIWETWLDGCGDVNGVGGNGTGSCVYSDNYIVHSPSALSMRYYYDCSGEDMSGDERDCNYAIATRAIQADLSSSCAETIELWFYGDPDNDNGPLEAMFLAVKDGSDNSAVATYGDTVPESPDDMLLAEWQQWDIALTTFGGVDTTDIVSMSLGFGDITNCHREKGGYGVMRFDDICVFPCRCVPKYTPDIVDLNADCKTNWLDIKIVADNWLEDEYCNQ